MEEDKKKKENYRISQKELKKFLDLQVEEKKKNERYERVINDEQARIWKQDVIDYRNQEKDIQGLVNIHLIPIKDQNYE